MPLRPQDGGKVKNRLFIPESRCCENSGVRALYTFGEHQALGFSPFAIDQASPKETESVTQAYNLLSQEKLTKTLFLAETHHSIKPLFDLSKYLR